MRTLRFEWDERKAIAKFNALKRGGPWWLIAGCIFGVETLNRPNMPLGVAGIAGVLLLTRRVRPAVVLVAGLIIGMAPAAIRNGVVSHEWSFVSSHGGLNFYIGNSETATGFFHQLPGITPNIAGQARDAQRVAGQATGRAMNGAAGVPIKLIRTRASCAELQGCSRENCQQGTHNSPPVVERFGSSAYEFSQTKR
jgi:hypothetical protein